MYPLYSFPCILLGITGPEGGYFILSRSGAAGLAESKRRTQLKASWYISGRALLPLHKSSASGEMRFGARKLSGSAVIWWIRIDFFRCKKPRLWYIWGNIKVTSSLFWTDAIQQWAVIKFPCECRLFAVLSFSVFQATRYILIILLSVHTSSRLT